MVYYYERTLSSQVNDIEHIESQSLNSYGVVKIFFQKTVDIRAALAQVRSTPAQLSWSKSTIFR